MIPVPGIGPPVRGEDLCPVCVAYDDGVKPSMQRTLSSVHEWLKAESSKYWDGFEYDIQKAGPSIPRASEILQLT